jgi:hypothetical protein
MRPVRVSSVMIKQKLLLVAIVAASFLLPAAARAVGIEIHVNDQPYYSHGPHYWLGDYQMIWVPGHMYRNHWMHGHYIRGEHRRDFHRSYHHDNDYRNYDRR